jgi:hypothetical protein
MSPRWGAALVPAVIPLLLPGNNEALPPVSAGTFITD